MHLGNCKITSGKYRRKLKMDNTLFENAMINIENMLERIALALESIERRT